MLKKVYMSSSNLLQIREENLTPHDMIEKKKQNNYKKLKLKPGIYFNFYRLFHAYDETVKF